MELFNVELTPGAYPKVDAKLDNRWLTDAEIQAGQTGDGQQVSATIKRLIEEIGRQT
jgi:hypothetical protein